MYRIPGAGSISRANPRHRRGIFFTASTPAFHRVRGSSKALRVAGDLRARAMAAGVDAQGTAIHRPAVEITVASRPGMLVFHPWIRWRSRGLHLFYVLIRKASQLPHTCVTSE